MNLINSQQETPYDSAEIQRGYELIKMGKLQEAYNQFLDCMKKLPPQTNKLKIIKGLIELKKYEDAISLCLDQIDLFARSQELYINYSLALYFSNRFDDSLQVIEKAISINPENAQAFTRKTQTLQKLRRFDEASFATMKAINLDPICEENYINQIQNYIELKHYDKALESCTQALKINPKSHAAFKYQCQLYQEQGDFDRALELCKTTTLFDGKHDTAFAIKGDLLMIQNDFEEAFQAFDNLIRINPKYQDAYVKRGSAFLQLARYQEAIEDCNKALEIDHKSIEALKTKCAAYFNLEESLNQEKGLLLGIELHPKELSFYQSIAVLYKNSMKFDQALGYLDKALLIDPNDVRIRFTKTEIRRYLKEKVVAESDFFQVVELVCGNKGTGLTEKQRSQYNSFYRQFDEIRDLFKFERIVPNFVNDEQLIEFSDVSEALKQTLLSLLISRGIQYCDKLVNEPVLQVTFDEGFKEVKKLLSDFRRDVSNDNDAAQVNRLMRALRFNLIEKYELSEKAIRIADQQEEELRVDIIIQDQQQEQQKQPVIHDPEIRADIIIQDQQQEQQKYPVIHDIDERTDITIQEQKQPVIHHTDVRTGLISQDQQQQLQIYPVIHDKDVRKDIITYDQQQEQKKYQGINNKEVRTDTITIQGESQEQQRYPVMNDNELVKIGFIKINKGEVEPLNYCKTFYWTSLNLLVAYRIVTNGNQVETLDDFNSILKRNYIFVQEGTRSASDSIRDTCTQNDAIDILSAYPLSCAALIEINGIINDILWSCLGNSDRDKQQAIISQEMFKQTRKVISRKLSSDSILSIELANAAIELTNTNEQELLYPQKIKSNTQKLIENKISLVKDQVVSSLRIVNQDSLAVQAAIRDAVFLIVLFATYGQQIAEIKQPLHRQVVQLINGKKVEEMIQNNQMQLNISQKQEIEIPNPKQPSTVEQKPKKGCQCTIF